MRQESQASWSSSASSVVASSSRTSGDEAERDVEVAAAVDARHHRAARRARRPRARRPSIRVCGKRVAQPLHRVPRPARVGQGDLRASSPRRRRAAGRASRSSRRPRSVAQRAGHRRGHELGAARRRRRRGRPARSPWCGRPRRTSRPAGSRCSARSRSACAARAGGRGRRSRRRRTALVGAIWRPPTEMSRSLSEAIAGAASAAPATKAWASTTERAPGRGGEVGVDPAHRRARAPPRGCGPAGAHGCADRVGLEVGDAVDRDRAVRVLEQHRGADVLPAGAQVHPGGVGEPGVEARAGPGSRGCRW